MNAIETAVVIDDCPDIRESLVMSLQCILGLMPQQILEYAENPDIAMLKMRIRNASSTLLICDRNLTKGGAEGDAITRRAKKELQIEHVAMHSATETTTEFLEQLNQLGILFFLKGDPGLFQWLESLKNGRTAD